MLELVPSAHGRTTLRESRCGIFASMTTRKEAGLVGEHERPLNYICGMALLWMPRIDDFAASARRFARRN
jgi:hypothetical protein